MLFHKTIEELKDSFHSIDVRIFSYKHDNAWHNIFTIIRFRRETEDQLEKIIQWIKTLKKQPSLGIQNFLRYKTGRSPAKEVPWKDFYANLEVLEKKYKIKLKLQDYDFSIRKTKTLEKPFQNGEVVNATIKCPDRFKNSVIAVAKDRNISVPNCPYKKDKKIRVEIVRDKHNIFTGKLVT